MLLRESELIKVKAMSKSMAKQIQICTPYGDETYRAIIKAFEADTCRPIGWVAGDTVCADGYKYWLVDYEGQFYFVLAPYAGRASQGTPEWMQICCKNLPQVFIG